MARKTVAVGSHAAGAVGGALGAAEESGLQKEAQLTAVAVCAVPTADAVGNVGDALHAVGAIEKVLIFAGKALCRRQTCHTRFHTRKAIRGIQVETRNALSAES